MGKSIQEWEDALHSLGGDRFHDLCFALVLKNPVFKNPIKRGKGADGGRDIEATFTTEPMPTVFSYEKWWFQCKCQKEQISYSQISDDLNRIENESAKKYVVFSNSNFNNPAYDQVSKYNEKKREEIIPITGQKFIEMMRYNKDLVAEYLGDDFLTLTTTDTVDQSKKFIAQLNEFGYDIKGDVQDLNKFIDFISNSNLPAEIKTFIIRSLSIMQADIDSNVDAILNIEKAIKINPNDGETIIAKSYILDKADRIDDCIFLLENHVLLHGPNKHAYRILSNAYARKRDLRKALAMADEALNIDPLFLGAILNKLSVLIDIDELEEGLTTISALPENVQKTIEVQLKLGLFLQEKNDFENARKIYEELLEKYPDNPQALNDLAVLIEKNFIFSGKKDKDMPDLIEKLLKKAADKKLPIAVSNVIYSEHKAGKKKSFENITETSLQKNPWVQFKLLQIQMESGSVSPSSYEEMEKITGKIVSKDTMFRLAKLYFDISDFDRSEQIVDKILKFNMKNSNVLGLKIALLQRKSGHHQARITYYGSLRKSNYNEPKIANFDVKKYTTTYLADSKN